MVDISDFKCVHSADRNMTVPNVGIIHGYSVGSTAHTTGFDMHFLAEGSEEPQRGSVRFSTFVAEDGRLEWRFVSARGKGHLSRDWRLPAFTEHDQPYFSAEVMAAMRTMVETLGDRDRNSWFFQALGAVEVVLTNLVRTRANIIHTDTHLSSLLSDLAEPRSHFVTKEECGAEKGYLRPSTESERDERRALWKARVAEARNALTVFDAEKSERIALLNRLKDAICLWSSRKSTLSPMELYANAIPEPMDQAQAA